jgi:hypothetical protein
VWGDEVARESKEERKEEALQESIFILYMLY